MKSSEFKKIIAKEFAPFLRKQGWKGSGFDFRQEVDGIINVLKIQPLSSGGKFCIEIGVYFNFLPPLKDLEFEISPKKITTWDLEIRTRLTANEENDYWWDFPKNENAIDELFIHIMQLFLNKAVPYFDNFQNWEAFIASITIDKIENGESKYFYKSTQLNTAMFVARMKEYLAEKNEAILFAKYGLSKIDGVRGSGLVQYFEKIINNCS